MKAFTHATTHTSDAISTMTLSVRGNRRQHLRSGTQDYSRTQEGDFQTALHGERTGGGGASRSIARPAASRERRRARLRPASLGAEKWRIIDGGALAAAPRCADAKRPLTDGTRIPVPAPCE